MDYKYLGPASRERKTKHGQRGLEQVQSKSRFAGKKHRKNYSKPSFPNQKHSTTSRDIDISGRSDSLSLLTASCISDNSVVPMDTEGKSARTESLHPYIYSHGESGGWFSVLFRRRKRSKSDTDIPNNEHLNRLGTVEDLRGDQQPTTLTFKNSTSAQNARRSNLKRNSAYLSFDSRIQPRDRLCHMTIKDAVKQQRLRRSHSAYRPTNSANYSSLRESNPVVKFTSSPSLSDILADACPEHVDEIRSSAVRGLTDAGPEHVDEMRSSAVRGLTDDSPEHVDEIRSSAVRELMRKHRSESEISNSPKPRRYVESSQEESSWNQKSRQDLYKTRQSKQALCYELTLHEFDNQAQVKQYVDAGTNKQHVDAGTNKQHVDAGTNMQHSLHDGNNNNRDLIKPRPKARSTFDHEEERKIKMKRKASLSKFLQLRQTIPTSYSRPRPKRQSSDSGVTDSDTSPNGSLIYSYAHRQKRQEKSTHLSNFPMSQELTNPCCVRCESKSWTDTSRPLVVLSETEGGHALDRLDFIKLDDSTGKFSSLSSSSQINSMNSSFRSSDQGYANTETDEEASFSTPPEDTDISKKYGNIRLNISPLVLNKLLEPSPESKQTLLPTECELQNLDDQRCDVFRKDKEDLPHRQPELLFEQEEERSNPRYVPRGIRRSQSDVSTRFQSPVGIYRQATFLADSAEAYRNVQTEWAEKLRVMPALDRGKLDLDLLSASSTTALANKGGAILVSENHMTRERSDHKLVPVMGTLAQQRYRRTYSPSRMTQFTDSHKEDSSFTVECNRTISPARVIPMEKSLTLPAPESNNFYPINVVSEKTGCDSLADTEAQTWQVSEEDHRLTVSPGPLLQKVSREFCPVGIVFHHCSNSDMFTSSSVASRTYLPATAVAAQTRQPVTNLSVLQGSQSNLSVFQGSQSNLSVLQGSQSNLSVLQGSQSQNNFHQLSLQQTTSTSNNIPASYIPNPEVVFGTQTLSPSKSSTENFQEKTGLNLKKTSVNDTKKTKSKTRSNMSFKKENQRQEKKRECVEPAWRSESEDNAMEMSKQPDINTGHQIKAQKGSGLKIMLDKENQTSSWLIDTSVRKKSSKPKKKSLSFSIRRKKARRESSASDTFIQPEQNKLKDATFRSSLGDLRFACATGHRFARKLGQGGTLSSNIDRKFSEKITSKRDKKKKLEEDSIAHEASPVMSGGKPEKKKKKDNSFRNSKKLTLPAVTLLRNRLARFREKKQLDKSQTVTTEDNKSETKSETEDFINFENELSLSKLDNSKETDLIDEVFFQPEFSLDYSKRQLRFEPEAFGEAAQCEQPVPALAQTSFYRGRRSRESTLRQRRRRCAHYCKNFVAFLFSHVGLCSLVVAYTIMGGFMFLALESESEVTVRKTIKDRREKVVEHLISLAVELQKTERGMDNFTTEVNNTVLDYQGFIHKITKDKGWDGIEGADEEGLWTFASSLLYAISVMTTIGYGHVAPKTPEGRIVTIGYAVVGIPLTLLCLTNIGDVMATGFRLLYGRVCCGVCCRMFKFGRHSKQPDLEKGLGGSVVSTESQEADKAKEVVHVPTSLCFLLIAGYIFAGAMLFSMWESWDILTGSYFCFITLSTIGFGDIVPGMDSNAWAAEEKLVLCALYLILGLSLIAMCFNLVQEDVKAKCRWLGMKLGIVDKHETPAI